MLWHVGAAHSRMRQARHHGSCLFVFAACAHTDTSTADKRRTAIHRKKRTVKKKSIICDDSSENVQTVQCISTEAFDFSHRNQPTACRENRWKKMHKVHKNEFLFVRGAVKKENVGFRQKRKRLRSKKHDETTKKKMKLSARVRMKNMVK